MLREFNRVAIVNRGEAAVRFIHAVREFNQERGESLRTIALFTDPDRHAMFVREADESVALGPAHTADPRTGKLKSSYVDYGRLEQALSQARAEAAWVGWGFVAEHAGFADLCRDLGIAYIGPDGDVMRLLGDKISSKLLAEQARIPVAPWSNGPVETLADARSHAERLGYPLLIKATAGGGGHGIRRVDTPAQLAAAFEGARAEAAKAFGDPTVYMEKLVEGARHVEVQIIADRYGTTWAAGVRDCTIQRRHQKIIEEAPSPALSPEQDEELRQAAVRLSRAAGYSNAGTVEFLYQPESRSFSFLEMNTRLQVEHPVTECTTGLDLVKLQIHVARGGRLEGPPPKAAGHAVEVRLYAEDPDNRFAPAPGVIERFRIAAGPGVRIDTGVAEGDAVPAEFDSMIAKIIARGRNRGEALARLQRVLRESMILIKGGATNKTLLIELLGRPEVQRGEVDIGWLDRLAATGGHLTSRHAEVALVHAAIEAYTAELHIEQQQFYASAVRGRPQLRGGLGRTVELRCRGQSYSLRVCRLGPKRYRIEVDGARVEAAVERLGEFQYWLTVFGRRYHVVSVVEGLSFRIDVEGVAHRVDRDDGGIVRSPAPAVVTSLLVEPGDTVQAGAPVAVLEAMKMEMQVVAPVSGRIRHVMTIPYVQVAAGAPLVQIEPAVEMESEPGGARVAFQPEPGQPQPGEAAEADCLQVLGELRQLMLGFDVDPAQIPQITAVWERDCAGRTNIAEIRRREEEIFNIFVDVCSLFGRRPKQNGSISGEGPTAEAYLFTYLRMLETQGEGLPATFLEALRRALTHYGVTTLERSPELEESLFWIYKSHERMERQVPTVMALLERHLERADALPSHAAEPFRNLLDRMVSVTRGMFPALSDLAREVRYRYFDRPLFHAARARIYAEAEAHLAALAADSAAAGGRERMRALVECPQPLESFLLPRFAEGDAALRRLILEVLTARYYRIRTLIDFRSVEAGGYCCATAEYDYEGKRIHVIATHAVRGELACAARALGPLLAEVPADDDVVLDFLVWSSECLGDPDRTDEEIRSALAEAGFPRPIRRIVLTVAGPGCGQSITAVQHFTYRQREERFEEEKSYRGLHPMLAKRLHLRRLANFNIERLPSSDEIYLWHAVAHENPNDERLIACAEVRDLTPVRDENGRIVQLPHLERMFTEAAAGIRLFRRRRPLAKRLYWNRILLYVWPPLELKTDEFDCIVRRLVPVAADLGLEQVVVRARIPNPATGELRDMLVRISSPANSRLLITFRPAGKLLPIKPLTEYEQKVVRMRQRGLMYPYEIVRMLTPRTPAADETRADFPPGDFVEYDLDASGRLVPVDRPYGQNTANVIVGVIRNYTPKYPEGMTRVMILGDPSRNLGALAEPECRRMLGAIEMAASMGVPVEWFAISAGAKISMDSGVENMDWIARVLRGLVLFTQAGGEVNVIVNGINVGAQPYWNAEATMLMHTRGILVMTPKAAMVLTGKRALDYSGGVSAEDNEGIGGYDRIMGPNGQAQYFARDIDTACHILLRHYEHTYVVPGERFPRRTSTSDPIDRDVRSYPHSDGDEGFSRVGDIFSDETNPGRKKSFDIRKLMMSVIDQDHSPLERWAGMRGAETAVVWDAHLGGIPVCLIGIESRPVPRLGFVPADGPDQWCAGTLFPLSSKKVARAINAASNNRPVVMLANLSGFDGSPESLRKLQLEYGAEIGRAVVNFRGPMVFCVVSRYHGGAYVVFSRALNDQLEVAALEGTFASVIGGAPAAAVVFAGEVEANARKDPRLRALQEAIAKADGLEKSRLRAEWDELFKVVRSEKLGEMAEEFDRVHSVHRALEVGALHRIIPAATIRPYLIDAVERGVARSLCEHGQAVEAPETAAATVPAR